MDKYENLGLVGEGSYGVVMKCRHKETRELVAIKKFLESEDDRTVRKIALREIKLLKLLRHDNLVKILEVFRRKKRLYLVFEFIDRTVLDDLERHPRGLEETYAKRILFQVIRGIEFCHQKDIIHRDVKPENILVTKDGIVKVCDFGFARVTAGPGDNLTDYVATRWYRAPELIVGDCNYGKPVDVWAMGCLYSEMLNGDPLFPGDSDIDQLDHIIKCLGNLPSRYEEIFRHNPIFRGVKFPEVKSYDPFDRRYPRLSRASRDFIKQCLQLDANDRPSCTHLLDHDLFTRENFASRFLAELRLKLNRDELNKSPNVHRKAPCRDQSPAKKAAPKVAPPPPRKEESTVSFALPAPGATAAVAMETERTPRTPQPPVKVEERAKSPAASPTPAQPEAMDVTRLSQDEDSLQPAAPPPQPPPPAAKKTSRTLETPLPMPPIASSVMGMHQADERASPIHVANMTPAFPSSPTPQSFNTGPPPLKVGEHKTKKLSLYKKAPAFPNPPAPTQQPPMNHHDTYKPSGFYAFNLSGVTNRVVERGPGNAGSFTLPALKGSEMPLNKPQGHTPSGKPKKDFWTSGFFRR